MQRPGVLLLALILCTSLAFGQKAAPSQKAKTAKPAASAKTASSSESAKPAVTIDGVCPTPKTAKSPRYMSPDCKTVISAGTIDKLIDSLNPNMPPATRRNLGGSLGEWTALAAKAREMGVDKTADYKEVARFAQIQLLAQTLVRKLQKDAENVPDSEIQAYYDSHKPDFEEFTLDRVIVPREQPAKDKTVDPAAEKQFADSIRERLVKGEDPKALQTEAFKHADQKAPEPPVELAQRHRSSLPPSQEKVFDLKPGEVSEVFSDPAAFFIYKMVKQETPPLTQVSADVKRLLAQHHMRSAMEKINSEFKVHLDPSYFGPEPQMPPPGAPSLNPQSQSRPVPPPAKAPAPPASTQPSSQGPK